LVGEPHFSQRTRSTLTG
jgi:hypothetical protein